MQRPCKNRSHCLLSVQKPCTDCTLCTALRLLTEKHGTLRCTVFALFMHRSSGSLNVVQKPCKNRASTVHPATHIQTECLLKSLFKAIFRRTSKVRQTTASPWQSSKTCTIFFNKFIVISRCIMNQCLLALPKNNDTENIFSFTQLYNHLRTPLDLLSPLARSPSLWHS